MKSTLLHKTMVWVRHHVNNQPKVFTRGYKTLKKYYCFFKKKYFWETH